MFKKVLAIFVAMHLVVVQVSADSIGNLIYSNSTGAGSWSDPGNGGKFYYGGNFEFRFKNTKSFTPLVVGSPPQLKIGCNGLSIKGGFLALLGLDDIKLQLQNAGALFAWGVMVGLELSMPSLAAVFHKLQQWARTLQKLMQNMCSLGQRFAQKSGLKGALDPVMDKVSSQGYGPFKDAVSNIDKMFEAIDNYVDGVDGNQSETQGKVTRKLFQKGASISMLAAYFGKYMPETARKMEYEGSLSQLYSKKIGDLSLVNTSDPSYPQKVLLSKLTFLFFGDLALNKEGVKSLRKLLTNGTLDKQKAKEFLKAAATGIEDVYSNGLVSIPAVIGAEDVAQGLIYGFDKISSDYCSGGICKIPDYKVFYYNIKLSLPSQGSVVNENGQSQSVASAVSDIRVKGLVLTNSIGGTAPLNVEWKGFYRESLKAIRYLVYQKSGMNNYTWYQDNYDDTRVTSADLNTIAAPLMLPNITRYVDIIAKYESKQGGENGYTAHLKYLLAKANAHFASIALANGILSLIEQLEGDPNTYLTNDAVAIFQNYKNQMYERQKQIIEGVKRDMESENELEELISLFEKLEQDLNKDILKARQ